MADLERLETITFFDLARFVNQIGTLIENPATVWNKHPWTDFYDHVRKHILVDILKEIEKNNKKIKEQLKFRTTSVSEFQHRILGRIRFHAKNVERAWLGSASIIEIEPENTISQVWKLMREDRSIDKRETKTDEGAAKTSLGDERSAMTAATAIVPNDDPRLYQTPLYTNPLLHSIHDSSSRLIQTNVNSRRGFVTSWLYYLSDIASASDGIVRRNLPPPLSTPQPTSSIPPSQSNDIPLAVKKTERLIQVGKIVRSIRHLEYENNT
ncbi:hypothetical protein RSAG8_08620, partial [Rhizoctonia solani AG-8 WAC10335]